MPQISKSKKDRISEQILHHLFSISPSAQFTNAISEEIARDEEFTKSLLKDLESKKLILLVDKNSKGINYLKRQRWRLSPEAFNFYQKAQEKQNQLQDNNLYNLRDI